MPRAPRGSGPHRPAAACRGQRHCRTGDTTRQPCRIAQNDGRAESSPAAGLTGRTGRGPESARAFPGADSPLDYNVMRSAGPLPLEPPTATARGDRVRILLASHRPVFLCAWHQRPFSFSVSRRAQADSRTPFDATAGPRGSRRRGPTEQKIWQPRAALQDDAVDPDRPISDAEKAEARQQCRRCQLIMLSGWARRDRAPLSPRRVEGRLG